MTRFLSNASGKGSLHMRIYFACFVFICAVGLLNNGGTPAQPKCETSNGTQKIRIKQMNFSKKGFILLKPLEGFKQKIYMDSSGNPSIGYGHKIKKGETFKKITEQEGEYLLRQDIAPVEKFINVHLNTIITQNQFDALVIFIYNIGATAFLSSQVFEDLKNKKYDEATKPWSKWVHITKYEKCISTGERIKKLIPVEGLISRRETEIQLFNG